MAERELRAEQPVAREDVAAECRAECRAECNMVECRVECNMAEWHRRAERHHRKVRRRRVGRHQKNISTECHFE